MPHQAAQAAGLVNNATARSGPEVRPAQGAPRAQVAQSVSVVVKAALLVPVDEPAARAGNSQAAAEPQAPEVLPPWEAPPEPVAPPAQAEPQVRAAFQARVASPDPEA